MYGSNVPTAVNAGVTPAVGASAAFGMMGYIWIALLLVTIVTIGAAVCRLTPRREV